MRVFEKFKLKRLKLIELNRSEEFDRKKNYFGVEKRNKQNI